jgi:hypothetical protein
MSINEMLSIVFQVNKLDNLGHEIAVHSITHKSPESWWENNATIEDWFDEMVGQVNKSLEQFQYNLGYLRLF